MSNKVLLSIITITYENPSDLDKTLSSVASYCLNGRVEHIVVDGSSSYECQKVSSKYPHVNKIIHETDNGRYDAMNKGILYASGSYLLFLNSGDQISSEFSLKSLFETINSLNIDHLIYSDVFVNTGVAIYKKNAPSINKITNNPKRFQPYHAATLFPSSLFSYISYDTSYKISADRKITLKALRKYPAIKINNPISIFTFGGISNFKLSKKAVIKHCLESKNAREQSFLVLFYNIPVNLIKHFIMKSIGYVHFYNYLFSFRRLLNKLIN